MFLHGLTFDHHMWDPVLEALPSSHTAIAFDLPGHGSSVSLLRAGLAPAIDTTHAAVRETQLEPPILVGHSIAGQLAALYATQHPTAGILSVDVPPRVEPFAELLRSLQDQLRATDSPRCGRCSKPACTWSCSQARQGLCSRPATGRATSTYSDRS